MTTRRSSWRSAPQPRARPQGRPLQAVHAAQRSHAAALRGGQVAPRPSRIDVRGRARRWKGTFDVIVLDLADPVECGPAFPLWSVRPRFLPPHASQRATPSAPRGHGCLPLPAPAGRARTRARECRPRQPRLRLLGPRPGMEHRGVSGKPCSTSAGNKEAHSFTAEKFHFFAAEHFDLAPRHEYAKSCRTKEYYQTCFDKLAPDGIIVTQAGPLSANQVTEICTPVVRRRPACGPADFPASSVMRMRCVAGSSLPRPPRWGRCFPAASRRTARTCLRSVRTALAEQDERTDARAQVIVRRPAPRSIDWGGALCSCAPPPPLSLVHRPQVGLQPRIQDGGRGRGIREA